MRAEARQGQTGRNRRLSSSTLHARDARYPSRVRRIAAGASRAWHASSGGRKRGVAPSFSSAATITNNAREPRRGRKPPLATRFFSFPSKNFADLAARLFGSAPRASRGHFERAPARPRCPYRRSRSSRDPPVPPHSARAPRRSEPARAPPRAPPGKMRRKAREGLTTRVWSAACST